jgi:hypothetical protein
LLDFQILIGYYTGKMAAGGRQGLALPPENASAVMCMRGFSALSQINSALPPKSKFLSFNYGKLANAFFIPRRLFMDKELFEKALKMAPNDRLTFAELILASIDFEEEEVRNEWIQEVHDRIKAVNDGRAKLLDFERLYNAG